MRSSDINYNIRRRLNKLSKDELSDYEIFDKCNQVQRDIMLRTRCVNYIEEIQTVSGQQTYTLENVSLLKAVIPNEGQLVMLGINDISKYAEFDQNGTPKYYVYNGNKIYLAPIPTESLYISFVGFKLSPSEQMSHDTEPEIPSIYDEALEYGVCSKYDPNYLQLYEKMLDDYKTITSVKTTIPKGVSASW